MESKKDASQKAGNGITALIFTAGTLGRDVDECVEAAQSLTDIIVLIHIGGTGSKSEIKGVQRYPIEHVAYVEMARSQGIQYVKTPWVFVLDADERITPELAQEVKQVIREHAQNKPTHYQVARKNIFAKTKWLQWGGWWPDYQTRLIHTPSIRSWPSRIHSTAEITGTAGMLTHPFEHYFHGDLHEMVTKTIKYEGIESDLLHKAGRNVGVLIFMRKFAGELYRRALKHQGFRDGTIGWIESIYQAYSKTITYLLLFEKTYIEPKQTS